MKKSRIYLLSALLLLAFTAACSQVPQATSHPYSVQRTMQAMHHWDVLADDVAAQVRVVAGRIFIAPPPKNSSPFQQGFHDLLITRLVNQGVEVPTTPDPQTFTLEYKLQTIRHQADRGIQRPPPGMLTTLAGGMLVLRNALDHGQASQAWKGAGLAGAVAVDLLWDAFPAIPDHELLITSTITHDGRYIFRRSDLYYINGADAWHYREKSPTPARRMEISG